MQEQRRDGGDAVGAEEGELESLVEGEGELSFGEGFLDQGGGLQGHGLEGVWGGVLGFEAAEAERSEDGGDDGVEDEREDDGIE